MNISAGAKPNALFMRFTLNSDDPKKKVVLKENLNEITGRDLIDLGVDLSDKYNHTVCMKINIFPNSGEAKLGNIRIIEAFPLMIKHVKNGVSREDKICKATLLSIFDFFTTRIKLQNSKYLSSFLFFEKYEKTTTGVEKEKTEPPKKKIMTNIDQHQELKLTLSSGNISKEIEKIEQRCSLLVRL